MPPQVSVIMTSFNYASYIKEAINSIINQKFNDWELIIIDDGSTDNSIEIISAYIKQHPTKIKCLVHNDNANLGIKASLDLGLKNANGTYVAFCESDDYWTNDFLFTRTGIFNCNSDAVLVFGKIIYVGTSSLQQSLYRDIVNYFGNHYFKNGNYFDYKIFKFNPVATFSNLMIKKIALDNFEIEKKFEAWSDLQMLVYLALQGKFYFINTRQTHWRLHPQSLNHQVKYSNSYQSFNQLFLIQYRVTNSIYFVSPLKIVVLKILFVLQNTKYYGLVLKKVVSKIKLFLYR